MVSLFVTFTELISVKYLEYVFKSSYNSVTNPPPPIDTIKKWAKLPWMVWLCGLSTGL